MQEKLEKRIYRNRKQQQLELKTIYNMLMEGKTNNEIITELNLKEDTYYRYKRMLLEECNTEFKNLAKEPYLELGLSTAILHDRLSNLYNLCLKRLNNTSSNDKGYSDLTEIMQDIAVMIFKLDTQGVQAAIEIAKRANTIDVSQLVTTN
jgi:hypothetical protein